MIASVHGIVRQVSSDHVVVDVGGVGLLIACTPMTARSLHRDEPATLSTTLIVREDSLTLYGFVDDEGRDLFSLVQTVSGIGPRIALALLATLSPDEIRDAVAREDLAMLTRAPGIGRKGAQRMVLELKDRVGAVTSQGVPSDMSRDWRDSVRVGLESLGWSTREAAAAVEAVSARSELWADEGAVPDVAELLKEALRSLDRTRG
jgi:holliday junction DNA helicase RuvA